MPGLSASTQNINTILKENNEALTKHNNILRDLFETHKKIILENASKSDEVLKASYVLKQAVNKELALENARTRKFKMEHAKLAEEHEEKASIISELKLHNSNQKPLSVFQAEQQWDEKLVAEYQQLERYNYGLRVLINPRGNNKKFAITNPENRSLIMKNFVLRESIAKKDGQITALRIDSQNKYQKDLIAEVGLWKSPLRQRSKSNSPSTSPTPPTMQKQS